MRPPRLEAEIDGGRAHWTRRRGARRPCSPASPSSRPSDGVPAADSTEVLVWYSPTAIHFGIRAFEAHGAVHATLADRDQIGADDHVQILLSTFNDGRQATVFAVNPLGVQSDGALVETGATSGGNGFTNAVVRRETADLSPDYVFESKGRVTELRLRGRGPDSRSRACAIQSARGADAGASTSLARCSTRGTRTPGRPPAARAPRSWPSPAGWSGSPICVAGWCSTSIRRSPRGPPASGTGRRLGLHRRRSGAGRHRPLGHHQQPEPQRRPPTRTSRQVESDAGQLLFDPRDELFFQEKRPFFLDGIEQFTTPNNLIYTRRIVQPVAAVKLTGKALGTDIALLSAVDDPGVSLTGDDHPIYNILRLQRDVGTNSRVGMVYTDRIEGDDYNRVAGRRRATRVRRDLQRCSSRLAGSRTRIAGATVTGAALAGTLHPQRPHLRSGRQHQLAATKTSAPRSGFFRVPGWCTLNFDPRVTVYGKAGSLMESVTFDVNLNGRWRYDEFIAGRRHARRAAPLQRQHHAARRVESHRLAAAGDLRLSLRDLRGLPHRAAPAAAAGPTPWRSSGGPRIPNRDYVLLVRDPGVQALLRATRSSCGATTRTSTSGRPAGSSSRNAGLTWRPTDKLRLDGTYAAPAGAAAERRQPGERRSTSRGSSWSTSSPARSSSAWSASTPHEQQDDAPGRHPDRSADPDLRRGRGRLRPGDRPSPAARSGATCCSPTSPLRAPSASSATAAPWRTRWIRARRGAQACAGSRTGSS